MKRASTCTPLYGTITAKYVSARINSSGEVYWGTVIAW